MSDIYKIKYDNKRISLPGYSGYIRYSATAPMSSFLYSDDTERVTPYTYATNLDLSDYRYCTIDYDVCGTTANVYAYGITLNPWGWNVRDHFGVGHRALRNGGTFTATNENTKTGYEDGSKIWYANDISQSEWVKPVFILDRKNSIVSAAINNTVYGYGTVNTGISSLTSINCYKEVKEETFKNLNILGFNSLTAINDYYNL